MQTLSRATQQNGPGCKRLGHFADNFSVAFFLPLPLSSPSQKGKYSWNLLPGSRHNWDKVGRGGQESLGPGVRGKTEYNNISNGFLDDPRSRILAHSQLYTENVPGIARSRAGVWIFLSEWGEPGRGVDYVDGPSGNCQIGMLTRVAKKGPTLSTECRSQLGR